MEALNRLSKLKTLKIHSTAISDGSIAVFNKMDGLREVYLWNTKISANGLKDLKSENSML
ncbi:MAG: hypothetical protein ACJAU2_001791 [Maribacter sp.]|jgi:hypothetical protein